MSKKTNRPELFAKYIVADSDFPNSRRVRIADSIEEAKKIGLEFAKDDDSYSYIDIWEVKDGKLINIMSGYVPEPEFKWFTY